MTPAHYHIWTRSIDGAEYGNVIIDNVSDASVTYYNMTQPLAAQELNLTIEDIIGPLQDGNAIFTGRPGFFVLLAGCQGGCVSPTWN